MNHVIEAAGLLPQKWVLCIQSCLDLDPWIRPFAEEVIVELPGMGVNRAAEDRKAAVGDN